MMNLKEKIEQEAITAQKEHREDELNLYRFLKSAVKNAEISVGHELNDEEVLVVLEKQAKQRRDSIEQFAAASRDDLVQKEKTELKIIETMLPSKMNEEEVRNAVKGIVAKNPDADFGRTMGMVMSQLKGKADGSLVQKVVKEELGN